MKDAIEMQEKASSKKKDGTKALGQSIVGQFTPVITAVAHDSDMTQTNKETMDRKFTASELANLTLHQVAREGDISLMDKLLEKFPQHQRKKRLNQYDDSKLATIHYATRYSHYHMMAYLIKNGANVQIKGEDDITPLHFIAKYKKKRHTDGAEEDDDGSDDELPAEESMSCLHLLVEHGAQLNAKDAMGLTPLHHACTRGNTSVVRELVNCEGIGLEITDNQGMSPLHLACLYGHLKIVSILVDNGANLRCKDKDATTPLHLVCAEGTLDIAKLLLEKSDLEWEEYKRKMISGEDDKKNNEEQKKKQHNRHISIPNIRQEVSNNWLRDKGGSAELLQEVDSEKNLPLHLAIENGHLSMVEFCLQQAESAGLDNLILKQRSGGFSCLHLAVQSNSLEIVKLLLDKGCDIDVRNLQLATPLYLACQLNSHPIIKHLLDKKANIELKDSDFTTPLHVASKHGHLEAISWLLKFKCDVTETDKDDRTCLMWAADENQTEAIKMLLQKPKIRLMIEERDKYNNTALHLAATKGHTNTVKLLLEFRASADMRNDDDRTTLHMASLNGHHSIIPDLIRRDRSVINVGDEESNSALHLACIGGNTQCIQVLIQLGANIELRNAKQWTPLDCAAAYGWEKAAKVLLEAGASVQPRGKIKVCALHLASQRGHVELIQLLLQWKADVTFRSADGRNALDFALDHSQRDCVHALIKHETWQLSLKNAVKNPITGIITTPMRKMIKKMEDMAEVVCNQCVTDNGKKPEDEDFAVTLLYEFFDDTYACSEWMEKIEASTATTRPSSGKDHVISETTALLMEENPYTVYDEHDALTKEAHTYDKNTDHLKDNHPLAIMVNAKCERLLVHPIVTGLLNYKWKRFGRYVYYLSLLFYTTFVVLLNVYMMSLPPFYKIEWNQLISYREMLNTTTNDTACIFYRSEVIDIHPDLIGCQIIPNAILNLRIVILVFTVINLLREAFQMLGQKWNYLDITNAIELALYILSLLVTLNFNAFAVEEGFMKLVNETDTSMIDLEILDNLQWDTGLRQEWQQEVGAFAVFLSWMVLLLFIQKIPRLGIFVVMFTDVMWTFAQFLFVFIFFIFGFAFSFTILMGNQLVFTNWYESLITVTVMTIGELDYGSKFFESDNYFQVLYSKQCSFVLFSIFLIMMTIIIMNLLVGLAVGDIIQVQEHATLERLSMQVDSSLEVEFGIPAFMRKSVSLRKQKIYVNKYKRSNFVTKMFREDGEMTFEMLSKAVTDDSTERDETISTTDKILTNMNALKSRIADLITDQVEMKVGLRGVRGLIRDVRREAQNHVNELKLDLTSTGSNLNERIDKTRLGLVEKTVEESNTTRGRVDITKELVDSLRNDVDSTKQQIEKIREIFEYQMERIVTSQWLEMEEKIKTSLEKKVEESQKKVLESLEEMKLVLVKEKFMTNV